MPSHRAGSSMASNTQKENSRLLNFRGTPTPYPRPLTTTAQLPATSRMPPAPMASFGKTEPTAASTTRNPPGTPSPSTSTTAALSLGTTPLLAPSAVPSGTRMERSKTSPAQCRKFLRVRHQLSTASHRLRLRKGSENPSAVYRELPISGRRDDGAVCLTNGITLFCTVLEFCSLMQPRFGGAS